MALYQTGNSTDPNYIQYDPQTGKPNLAQFWNSINQAEKYRLWGQGSATFFKRLSVYEQNCKQHNVHAYKTVTVTTTVTAAPTKHHNH
jgi:hypothetical protein